MQQFDKSNTMRKSKNIKISMINEISSKVDLLNNDGDIHIYRGWIPSIFLGLLVYLLRNISRS